MLTNKYIWFNIYTDTKEVLEMKVYEVWALAIDYNINDGYDDTKIGSFEDCETAEWFFHNYPFKSIPNTRITLEEVEYDDEGNASCCDVLAETFLD